MSTKNKGEVRRPRVAVGLVHHPIYNSRREVVATNITNFDIHDIARASRVYGVERYFIIHPQLEQQMFVHRVLDHWKTGQGSEFNAKRKTALTMVETASSVEAALESWQWGKECMTIATHARQFEGVPSWSFKNLRREVHEEGRPCFLIFGTGFGLTEAVMENCNGVLESLRGSSEDDYRHLSVRSAVSICLDRLLGVW